MGNHARKFKEKNKQNPSLLLSGLVLQIFDPVSLEDPLSNFLEKHFN